MLCESNHYKIVGQYLIKMHLFAVTAVSSRVMPDICCQKDLIDPTDVKNKTFHSIWKKKEKNVNCIGIVILSEQFNLLDGRNSFFF